MKKISCLCLMLCLSLLLCSCGAPAGNAGTSTPPANASEPAETTPTPDASTPEPTQAPDNSGEEPGGADPAGQEGPTGLDFGSDVLAMVGEWVLSEVYVNGEMKTPVENAISLRITEELDPSELVDGPAYIHNQVYNLTGYLTFGVEDIASTLAADDIEEFKGSTSWEDFPQGTVVAEGETYEQPGTSTMRFKDIDDYGLFLDQIAGVADLDTTEKTLIIGMNGDGQLLLGYSEEHIERPGTQGEWVYCLVFDK